MACRNAILSANQETTVIPAAKPETAPVRAGAPMETVFFGVDSTMKANTVLQHDLTLFDWVARNKVYPNFWGRPISGENAMTEEEAKFIHAKGCKIVPIYNGYDPENMTTELQGEIDAKKAFVIAAVSGVRLASAIFLQVDPELAVTAEYMFGYVKTMLSDGYIPGFCANTNASYDFSHQFSRGCQAEPDMFNKCRIWATSPNLPEYYETTDAHILYPDYWGPHCPSCMTQDRVAIWQYGLRCHPINDYTGNLTHFNVSIVKDPDVLLNRMF